MSATALDLDPIRLEIIANGLRSIADECFVALMRSSYSTNIKERKDHSIAIVDIEGRLVVQAELTLPLHIASMGGLMKCVLDKFGDDINEGDIFVANDPHTAGGTHLPDINYAMPIFIDSEIVAFICNIAHHADIGGMVPDLWLVGCQRFTKKVCGSLSCVCSNRVSCNRISWTY